MLNIGVLVSGSGTNLQAIIDALNDGRISNACIKTVISDRPDAFALIRASNYNIPCSVINRKSPGFDEALKAELIRHNVDLIVLAGFLSILGKSLLECYPDKIINVHPSLIPSFCGKGFYGLKVHEEAIKYGVKVSGATVHFVNEEPDGGAIIMQKTVQVFDNDAPEALQKRIMKEAEHLILPEVINLIANNRIVVIGRKVIIDREKKSFTN